MNRDPNQSVASNKWALDFDELSGRSTPPDRTEEILRRAAGQSIPQPRSSRFAQLRPAALVLLGFAVTISIAVLHDSRSATVGTTSTVAADSAASNSAGEVQDPDKRRKSSNKQDPKQRPGPKQTQPVEAQDPEGKNKADPSKAKPENPTVADKTRAIEAPEPPPPEQAETLEMVDALTKAQREFFQQAARLNEKLGQAELDAKQVAEARRQAEIQLSRVRRRLQQVEPGKKALLGKDARQRAELDQVRRLLLGRKLVAPERANNPLLQGDYAKSLQQLTDARSKLDRTTDPAAARKVIDDMTRILEQARLALWRQQEAAKLDPERDVNKRKQ